MQAGMMWFDNDKEKSLAEKVKNAADYYRKKYGRTPDLCMVNPAMLTEGQIEAGTVTIRPYHPLVKGHLWIGIDDSVYKKKV